MFIDSHAHLFDDRIDIAKCNLDLVDAVIVPAYKYENFEKALRFCETSKKYFCALGIHPEFASEFNKEIKNYIISKKDKIVAIGEIGLDCSYTNNMHTQIETFRQQLELAEMFDLPVIIHLRKEQDFKNFFEIIKDYKVKGVLHCFNGNLQDCKKSLDLGFYISFAGNLTYKGNVELRKIAKFVPMDSILIETDSPSMLPASFRRKGINTSQNISFVAEKLAGIKQISIQEIAEITKRNAKTLFKLN